jgi:CRP-like cAMP-binding protein
MVEIRALSYFPPCAVSDQLDHMIERPMNRGLGASNFPAAALADALFENAGRAGLWIIREFAKGQTIFEQGEKPGHFFILTSGFVKLTYATPNGDMWIKSLIVDQGIFGPSSLDTVAPFTYSAQAIEASQIISLPISWIRNSLTEAPELLRSFTDFANWVRLRKEAREADLLCKSAEERYLDLVQNDVPLLARLTQGDIARYLRVTPIAFSRIKRRLNV